MGNVQALVLTGSYVSTPDSVANSIASDIDVRIKVAPEDWTPAADDYLMAKVTATGLISWQFAVVTNGKLRLMYGPAPGGGSTGAFRDSTVATGFTDGTEHWVRATRRQSDGRMQFFTSSDGTSWSQLGTDQFVGPGDSIFNSTAPITIGARGDGGGPMAGNVYYAELRDGIGGTVIHSFDVTAVTKIGTRDPNTVAAGGPWTLVGTAWDWIAVLGGWGVGMVRMGAN